MNVLTVDFNANDASEAFTNSLKNTGFAVLKNHPINKEIVNSVYQEWQAFFNSNEKYDYLFDEEKQDGYFPPEQSETAVGHAVPDLKEFYHVYTWGRLPKSITETTLQLYHQLDEIACLLLKWVEQHTPKDIAQRLSMPLSEMCVDNPRTLFRMLHYPPLPDNVPEGAVRAAAHEDINLITLLLAATDSGLQVKDSTGKWLDITTDHGNLVVNAADMLQMATEHYYKSTTHRVVNPVGEARKRSRLSMPLFLHARDNVKLSEDYTANDYRMERLRKIGLVKE